MKSFQVKCPTCNGAGMVSTDRTMTGPFLLKHIIEIINKREKSTPDRLRKLNARLKEYTEEEIIAAAKAFSKSEWHRENKQMSVDNLLAPSKFGRWYAASQEPGKKEIRFV